MAGPWCERDVGILLPFLLGHILSLAHLVFESYDEVYHFFPGLLTNGPEEIQKGELLQGGKTLKQHT